MPKVDTTPVSYGPLKLTIKNSDSRVVKALSDYELGLAYLDSKPGKITYRLGKALKEASERAKYIYPSFRPISVTVRCSKEDHVIKLTKNGRLVLCNHTKADEQTVYALNVLAGSRRSPCRCMTIKKAWKQYCKRLPCNLLLVPFQLRVEAKKAVHRHSSRAKVTGAKTESKFTSTHESSYPNLHLIPYVSRPSTIARLIKAKLQPLIQTAVGVKVSANKPVSSRPLRMNVNVSLPNHDTIWYPVDLDVPLVKLVSEKEYGAVFLSRSTGVPNYYHFNHIGNQDILTPIKKLRFKSKSIKDIAFSYNWYDDVYRRGLAYRDGLIFTSLADFRETKHPYPDEKEITVPHYLCDAGCIAVFGFNSGPNRTAVIHGKRLIFQCPIIEPVNGKFEIDKVRLRGLYPHPFVS